MMYRLSFLLLLLIPLAAATARAQDAGPMQDTGLLLGLRYTEPIPRALPYYAGRGDSLTRPLYRTLYLTRRGDSVRLAATGDGLFVPRDTSFWRVDAKRSIYNDWVEDFVWAAPEGTSPTLPGIQVYNGEYCRGHRTQTIHYAGPDYLALEQRSAGYCEDAVHPWYFNTLSVVPLDSTAHLGLSISEVLGAPGRLALAAGADAFLAELDDMDREAYLPEPDEANWGIARRPGRWIVRGRLDLDGAAVYTATDFDLNLELRPPLVRRNTLFPSWDKIKAFAPDALDAFTAPSNDLLVILHPRRLTVHSLSPNGTIHAARLSLQLPPNTTPVLSRWVVGTRTAQWARHLGTPETAGADR